MMYKKDPKCKCCLFFFWGLLISVVILTSFSNDSRRFYLYLYSSWRFMICCWFQMKLQIWHVLLWTRFCLFVYIPFLVLFFFFSPVGMSYGERKSFPLFLSSNDSLSSSIPSFNPVVPINQGAAQLHTKLSTRSKALESALAEKTLKVFTNFMSQAKVENDTQFCLNPYEYAMFCWIYFLLGYSTLKCFSDEMSSLMPSLWMAANPYAGLWNFPGKVSQ